MQKIHPRLIDGNNRNLWFAARASAFAALCTFGMQPLVASAQANLAITVDSSAASRPTFGTSGNGTQVVNIVAPNAAGVSNNRFAQYNVGTGGVIINNATQAAQTQIGGAVQANAALGQKGASVVLMQVTSGSPTQLLGTTEVAGKGANLVIANPAGITCSGCGFLNAPRVTLATGTPTLKDDGSLGTLDVKQGTIAVDGNGLSGSASAVDLIARAMTINGKVQGKTIDAIAGANRVDYTSKSAAAQAGTGAAPQVAIDVQSLGSMYGDGAVRLIGTEAGVGVRDNGALNSLTGSVSVGANGDVTIGAPASIKAATDVNVNGANLTNNGSIAAARTLNASAMQALTNSGTLTADSMSVNARGTLSNTGKISGAGVRLGGDQSLVNTGTVEATQDATLAGDRLTLSGGSVKGDTVTLQGGTVMNQGVTVSAAKSLNVSATRFDNTGTLTSTGAVSVNASDTFTNQANGKLTGQTVQFGGVNATNAGSVTATQSINGNAMQTLDNQGTLSAERVSLTTRGTLSNSGKIAGSGVSMNADQSLTNKGIVEASMDGMLAGNQVTLSGGSVSGGTVTLQGGTISNQGTTVSAGQLLNINATRVDNSGTLSSGGDTRVNAMDTFANANGTLSAQNTLHVGAGTLDNRGASFNAGQMLDVSAQQVLNGNGRMKSAGALRFQSGSLDNTGGTISAQREAVINVDGKLTNDNGSITSSTTLSGTAGSLSNVGGTISAPVSADIRVAGGGSNGGYVPPVEPTPQPQPQPQPQPLPSSFVPPPGYVRISLDSPDLRKYNGFYGPDGYFYAFVNNPV
ncbi:two-partner secretion domain-containing protein [Paraburkholderia strydomiana]|uniref:Filamentous hemagglutinin N-terminal domain-containing protein n=1 Tax=Paraburkholderia strydomiana TaxID=1245417 RepID=A0ABW9BY43_9BURK